MAHGVMAGSFGGRSRWAAAFLCGTLGGLVGLCSSGWRSSRPTSIGLPSCSGCGRSDDFLYYLYGAAAHYGGSDPSGAGLPGRPQIPASGCGRVHRHLERPRSMGSESSKWDHYIDKIERYIFGELGGEEGQVQQCFGPGRRHGVRAGRDIEQGDILHPVCAGDGGHAGGSGGSYAGTTGGDDPEGEGDETATLRGFRHMAALRQEAPEVAEVQVVRDDAGRHVQLEDGGWTLLLPTLVAELQGPSYHVGDDGPGGVGKPHAVGKQDRDPEQPLRGLLAPDRGGRRQGKGGADVQDALEDKDGHRCRGSATQRLGPIQAVGSGLEDGAQRPRLLAGASTSTSYGLDGKGLEGRGHGTRRGDHQGKREREEGQRRVQPWRRSGRSEEAQQSSEEGSSKEEMGCGEGRVEELERRKREIWKRWRRKAWWSRPRWVWQSRRRRMLRLEQWEWPMRWIAARVTVQRKGAEVAPLHGVQVTGPPFERVPTEEGIWWLKMMGWFGWTPLRGKAHAGDEEASSSSQPPQVPKAEKGTKRKRFTGGDPPDKKEAPKEHIFVEGEYLDFEGYCGARPFVFLHHFSGQEDRLGQAVKEESEKIGLKVTTYSADIEKGHDLTADKPYQSHHFGAYMADIDGYHSGFPCNTFTKLRWRPLAGHPGPLRSKSEPYGFKSLSPEKKAECDKGTILMARSVDMVKAMEKGHQDMMVKGFATLENPPPSDHPQHISAWHMPELVQLVDGLPQWESAHFHTCAYQLDREVGSRHFKPQLVGGTLPGLQSLTRSCPCGNAPHEPIVGKERSARSAAYPMEFCRAYGRLAALHFHRVAKAEFLEGRREEIAKNIANRKKVLRRLEEGRERYDMSTAEIETRFPRELAVGMDRMRQMREETPEDRVTEEEAEGGALPEEPKEERATSSQEVKEYEEKEEKETSRAQEALHWTGGEGNYGMVRKGNEAPVDFQPIGGMRDPHLSVRKLWRSPTAPRTASLTRTW